MDSSAQPKPSQADHEGQNEPLLDNGRDSLEDDLRQPIPNKRAKGPHGYAALDSKKETRLSEDETSLVSRSRSSRSSQDTDLDIDVIQGDDPLNARQQTSHFMNGHISAQKQRAFSIQDSQGVELDDWQKEMQRLGNRQFLQKTLVNVSLIGSWYALSIAMSVYNKWMFSPGNLDFHYPLYTTSVHMIVQFFLACGVLFAFPKFRPRHGAQNPHDEERNITENQPEDPSKPIMTPWFYLTRIASCGSVTGLDIGLGNMSLKFISLTFFTMCKSSVLGFVLLFAILFRLEKPSWKIGAIIAVMTIGVIMMVAGETAFNSLGFALLMMASLFSGLRWSLTQILLRHTPATSNPFSTLFFLTPVMFVTLFIIAMPVEGFPALKEGLDKLAATKGLVFGICIILFPGFIAFCMTSAEFALLKRTSVVTLSVCGIFKEVLTITAAGLIFGDELTPINISGLLITIAAIAVYNVMRMNKMKRKEISKAEQRHHEENASMLSPTTQAAIQRMEDAAVAGPVPTPTAAMPVFRTTSGSIGGIEARLSEGTEPVVQQDHDSPIVATVISPRGISTFSSNTPSPPAGKSRQD